MPAAQVNGSKPAPLKLVIAAEALPAADRHQRLELHLVGQPRERQRARPVGLQSAVDRGDRAAVAQIAGEGAELELAVIEERIGFAPRVVRVFVHAHMWLTPNQAVANRPARASTPSRRAASSGVAGTIGRRCSFGAQQPDPLHHVLDRDRVGVEEDRLVELEQRVVRGARRARSPREHGVVQVARAPRGARLPTAFIRPQAPIASIGKLSSSRPTKMRNSVAERASTWVTQREVVGGVLDADQVRAAARRCARRSRPRRSPPRDRGCGRSAAAARVRARYRHSTRPDRAAAGG